MPLGLLGRGGMGEVQAALDLRLDREVALKVLRRADPVAEARLVREASLTARLDHPGIVPILSAGRLPDGRIYYTMPVIRGRSLADALGDAPNLAARLALVRPVLDAVEAVAHAHDKGVLHRDLKPANIMLGEHGATLVVDWGLAMLLEDAPAGPPRPVVSAPQRPLSQETWAGSDPGHTFAVGDEPPVEPVTAEVEPLVASGGSDGAAAWELTRPGQVFGTPAFMAPEQARGEPLGRATDVFALGGVLFQVLTGRPPRTSMDLREPIPPILELVPDAPRELVAIADRALRAVPGDRYPDAAALAADLGAWFEGRRVAAYAYSRWELLRRGVLAWRGPLTVAAVALVALATAVGFGWWRTVVERNKAIQAENTAMVARATSDRYLADALLTQTRVATAQGERARAEVLAAHRLRFGENPEARGILARFNGATRPRLLRRMATPCLALSVSVDGERYACRRDDRVEVRSLDGELIQSVSGAFRRAQMMGARGEFLFLDDGSVTGSLVNVPTGERKPVALNATITQLRVSGPWAHIQLGSARDEYLFRPEGPSLEEVPRCPRGRRALVMAHGLDGRTFSVCNAGLDGTAAQVFEGERELFQLSGEGGVPTEITVESGSQGRVVVGTERGWVYIWRSGQGAPEPLKTDLPDIANSALSDERLVVESLEGWASVWDLRTRALMVRLPERAGTAQWSSDGKRLITVGAELRVWSVGSGVMPTTHTTGGGVASVAISPGGARLAWGLGTGQVRVVDRETGRIVLDQNLDGGVVKDVAFSKDGALLATGTAIGTGALIFDVETGQRREEIRCRGVRRLAWLGDVLLIAAYMKDLLAYRIGDAAPTVVPELPQVGDLDGSPDGLRAVAILDDGRVFRLDGPELRPTSLGTGEDLRAAEATERYTYVIGGNSLFRYGRSGTRQPIELDPELCTVPLDVAVAPRDSLVAVGCLSSLVLVLRGSDLAVLAALPGHTGRVATLAFDSSGRWLVSGSWDGSVRLWDMSVLETPADVLVEALEQAWGMGLQEAIGS